MCRLVIKLGEGETGGRERRDSALLRNSGHKNRERERETRAGKESELRPHCRRFARAMRRSTMGSRGSLRTSVLLVGSLALSSLRSAHCGLHSWERGDSRSPHFARSWDLGSRFVVTDPHFPEDSGSAPGTRVYGVTTSTFVLSGDSTHNQAIVHWTGDNSSVSPGVCLYVSVGLCPCVSVSVLE